jgi:tRNA(Ile)-lysidine synthase
MAALGPFEATPRLAAGVSGGPDSMALAQLAHAWACARGGSVLALIVDHSLREESAAEAAVATARLARRGITARVLTVGGLSRGPALAERARLARFRALTAACAAEGILHLLLGHHRLDQAETVLIRALGGSGPAGLAGIAALSEAVSVRVLRPLLGFPPAALRAALIDAGMGWIDDPSNVDPSALRPRLRLARRDHGGCGAATVALAAASAASARQRAEAERPSADCLAERASIHPEGFGIVSDGRRPIRPDALAALLQVIAGAPYPPSAASVASLAAAPGPATLAGVRMMPAGRLGPGLLLVREPAAMAPPVAAVPGAIWDRRFRLRTDARVPEGATLGGLGDDSARLRWLSPLPAAVLRTLPAVRTGGALLAVPHLLYPDRRSCECIPLVFSPPIPAAAAAFLGCSAFGDA